jgi:hypothetical protein
MKLAPNLLEPIKVWKIRRKVSPGTHLYDMIALHKTLFICSGCEWKLGWKWGKGPKLYKKITMYHGSGHCDGCRNEESGSLFVYEGGHWWQGVESSSGQVEKVKIRDRRRLRLMR